MCCEHCDHDFVSLASLETRSGPIVIGIWTSDQGGGNSILVMSPLVNVPA